MVTTQNKNFEAFESKVEDRKSLSSAALKAGCPVVGREMLATGCTNLATGCTKLATGFPNDWVDQTMSYRLIKTTSFAKHPRLVEYNAEALVWIYCSCLLLSCVCWLSTQRASAESLARRRFLHCYVCCCQLLVQHCSSAVNSFLNSDCQQIRQQ
ncbi:serine/threonine-protein phosphatase 7 long form [Dorcoceras hygrometricum]|uniref:Serine/threonine-protein phosphatase 7 long form n=1 Tax=Dorcoceras hygrometricum TaxID=472368 RepID=A0A2Z7B7U0_9LAMI|nr:serine/threonine-protein phosphatase 7 long form [Dorcoceras hygrometricum]